MSRQCLCPTTSFVAHHTHFVFLPVVPESNGGLYLTRRGDFNAGSHINAFFRVQCKSAAPLGASADVKALMADRRQVTFFGKPLLLPAGGDTPILPQHPL